MRYRIAYSIKSAVSDSLQTKAVESICLAKKHTRNKIAIRKSGFA